MSRLVDIDEVIKVAENTFPQEDVRKIMWVLCHTPTAYNKNEVVEEIKKHSYFMGVRESMVETIVRIVSKGGVE